MAKQTYSEKLRDPRWQKLRLEIFNRDGFACRKCGDKTTTLAVHHLWYERGREPWDYQQDALITLCEPCHDDEFQLKEADRELLMALKRCGAFGEQIAALAHHFDVDNPLSARDGGIWPRRLSPFEWATVTWHIARVLEEAFSEGGTDRLFAEHKEAVKGKGFRG